MRPRLFPENLAGPFIQRRQELVVRPVAGLDQQVPVQNRGTGRALKSVDFDQM